MPLSIKATDPYLQRPYESAEEAVAASALFQASRYVAAKTNPERVLRGGILRAGWAVTALTLAKNGLPHAITDPLIDLAPVPEMEFALEMLGKSVWGFVGLAGALATHGLVQLTPGQRITRTAIATNVRTLLPKYTGMIKLPDMPGPRLPPLDPQPAA